MQNNVPDPLPYVLSLNREWLTVFRHSKWFHDNEFKSLTMKAVTALPQVYSKTCEQTYKWLQLPW